MDKKQGLKILGLGLENYKFTLLLMGDKILRDDDGMLWKCPLVEYESLKMQENKMLMIRGSHRHNENNSSFNLAASEPPCIQLNNFIYIAD